jgi:hemoglobin
MDASGKSLYERLGGVFPIAAVVDEFSERVLRNPTAGKESPNPELREWSNNQLGRLAGLKFMRTLWVCDVAGGPFSYEGTMRGGTKLGLERAHERFHIAPEEFDAVAGELKGTMEDLGVPEQEKNEVLAAFAAHKDEVTAGHRLMGVMPRQGQ